MANLNITQDFIPQGRRNRPGRNNPMQWITVHETGNTSRGAGARNHARFVKGDDAARIPVSWHYTVDDTETFQHLPENETAFHAGDGPNGIGNSQSIGIEIAVNSDGNFERAVGRAIALVADICRRRNIPLVNVVQHNHFSPGNKNCPQNIRAGRPFSWAEFIRRVGRLLEGGTQSNPPAPSGGGITYTVRRGDTLSGIARSHGIALAALVAANPQISNPDLIIPGHVIVVPWVGAPTQSIDEIAREVILGRWGDGAERVRRLTAAGHNASVVQRRVNEILAGR